ncbi:MAG: methyltransferase domain-containing protein [Bacteriovoracaceae bacterium]|nr:methyltransferase domain-containing protein [Bacteriovoracaceae bacterium]
MFERTIFFKEFLKNSGSTGAVLPSSKALSKAISSVIIQSTNKIAYKKPLRVLEVGAGTGVFSQEIIRNLTADDFFTIVEICPCFSKLLKEKLEKFMKRPDCPTIRIVTQDFLEFNDDNQYDFIISGVPLNNFSSKFVDKFIKQVKAITHKNGLFSYFEYTALRRFKHVFYFGKKLEHIQGLTRYFTKEIYPYRLEKKRVLWNFPPASVNVIKFQE